jgi:hypothetical protein
MSSPFVPQRLIALALDAEAGTAPEALVRHFELLASEMAFQSVGADPAGRLEYADKAPGYLVTTCADWWVYVPWPLAFAFPEPTLLGGLVTVAERVMLEGPGNVAISGSTAFSGVIAGLGDIDLAQYVYDPETLPARIQHVVQRSGPAVLVRVKIGREFRRPWDDLMAWLSSQSVTGRMKFDFVDDATPFDLMPVSNVVLPSDPGDRKLGAALMSFAYQEAVLVRADGPPWPLMNADELLRYLKYLVQEVHEYRHARPARPVKALKRALSLSRILGLDDLAQQAQAWLAEPPATHAAGAACIAELVSLWADLPADRQTALEPALTKKKQMAANLPPGAETDSPDSITGAVLQRVRDLLSKEGRTLEAWIEA